MLIRFGGYYLEYKFPKDLSPIELDILRVIIKIREKNKFFSSKTLLKACISKLKYPTNEIFLNLKRLYEKNILIEGKQLLKIEILNNENRKIIYQIINENPGIQLRELSRTVKLPLQTCIWHVVILKKFEFIKSIKYKNVFCFGNANIPDDLLIVHQILRKELNNRIVYELIQNPQKTIQDLSEKLNISRSTIQYHINELTNVGLIDKVQKGHSELLRIRNEDLIIDLLNIVRITS